ncbi:discoidin domain-containing protein [Micromonospora narathiwatensis]|uniref:F5/8 type C domain-containing protein n=1 Tax=Micromonospora narathiwatensis TaxID=299146 RepID=A0A1A8ZDX8_9ACTN|nr:discoidin domain-containing protein [Micromonospora narathiwatensis]SBT42009.1 F5/8 type C domain-containing protein [Micromonospora narathiwatensis]
MSPVPPHRTPPRRPARRLLAALASLLAATALVAPPSAAHAADPLLSQGRPTTASSAENAGMSAANATDGNTGTRWSSAFSDPQWLQVDLGATATVSRVVLNWEAAYARAYQIQTSTDGATWTTIWSTTTGTGGTVDLTVSGTGRYVRMYGTARATAYGYSLWEFQVYGSTGGGTGCDTATNAALGRPATASSTENAGFPATAAVDGNLGTRWSSAASDPQWLQVDLGSARTLCRVVLNWEAAYARAYQIQTSTDGTGWTTVYSTTTGAGGTETLTLTGTGRYVRVYGTARATGYGYSLWEFTVNTTGGGGTIPGGGSLGPNVITFDPTMSSATIQSQLDTVFRTQESNQFGTQRYALMFKPGDYSGINAQIGFYTSIMGLGRNPGDVRIHGDITVDAGWFNGNATQNFWRSAANMQVFPSAGFTRWAVSQAAPFRRMDIQGNLNLAPNGYGWASGGYIADSRVTGTVQPYSQQQWYTRDSNVGGFQNAVWNMVQSGVVGAPATSFPNPPYTTLAQTPVSRDAPYLYLDASGNYQVFVPSTRTNASGASWLGGATPGTAIPLSQFYVARPSDSTATINAALAQGLNLLFTPGVYPVTQTIAVNRPGTVVLGIGFPTLIPQNGVTAMSVADVDGVRLAGMLFDAGPVNSPVLLQVGPTGSTASHAANPTSVQDVFFRIGGAGAGKATTSLVVNQNDTLIDHIWAWRADHGTGVGWTVNTADTGLIVNGNNVTALGLFVEHYQKYEVIWNGNNGRTVFFQNELPYDPPNAGAWMNGSMVGYAAFKVANAVTSFEGWGMGSYCYFNVDPTIAAYHGFEAPNAAGVRFHDLLTVSLGGNGSITHVINDTGATAQGTNTVPVYLVNYP